MKLLQISQLSQGVRFSLLEKESATAKLTDLLRMGRQLSGLMSPEEF